MSWNLNLQLNQLYKVVKTLQTTALTNPLISNLNFANNSITSCNDVACVSITSTGASTIPTISNSLTCSSNIIQSDGSGLNYLQCGKIVPQRNLFIINTPKTYAISIAAVSYNGVNTYFTYTTPLTDLYSIPPGGGLVTISGTNVPAANTTFTLSASGAQTLYAQVNGNPAGLINPTFSSPGTLTWTYSGSAGITFQSDSVAYATFTTSSLTLTGNLIAQTISGTNLNGKLNIVGQATSTSGNVLYTANTTNTTGNYDLLTDASQHFTFTGGSGAGSNQLSVGGATNGSIVIPSTAGFITVPLIKNGTSDITLGNAQNTAGGFVNIGVMNNASNTTPNVSQNSNNLSIGWNRSGGDAEIDFINSSNAGFNFYARNSSSTITQVARIRGDNVASYAFSIGAGAYAYLGAGSYGTTVGSNAGNASMSGGSNTLVGYATGNALTDGYHNVCLGTTAGSGMTSGYKNTCIGWNAGSSIVGGSVNCYIGSGATASSGSVFGEIVIGQLTGNGNQTVTFGGAGASNAYFNGYTAGTPQFLSSGRLQNVSDIKTKSNILYLNKVGAIDTILKLKPAEFNYNADPYKRYCGFIADDVAEAMPNAVDGKKYKFYFETDADGKPKCDEDGNIIKKLDPEGNPMPRYLSLDTNEILSRSVLAIQEQNELIVNQQKQIDNQQKQIDELKLLLNQLINKPI